MVKTTVLKDMYLKAILLDSVRDIIQAVASCHRAKDHLHGCTEEANTKDKFLCRVRPPHQLEGKTSYIL